MGIARSAIVSPKMSFLESLRGGKASSASTASKVAVFGFNKDHNDLKQTLFGDLTAGNEILVEHWSSIRDSMPSVHLVVGHISKYSLKDLEQAVFPFIQSHIDEVVRRKIESKLILLIESEKKSTALKTLMQNCADMLANAVVDGGTDVASLIDVSSFVCGQ